MYDLVVLVKFAVMVQLPVTVEPQPLVQLEKAYEYCAVVVAAVAVVFVPATVAVAPLVETAPP